MRRSALLMCLLLPSACHRAPPASAPDPTPKIWGGLQDGKYAVGLTQIFARDTTRPALPIDSTARAGHGRQMQIVVWYPVAAPSGQAMTLGNYVMLGAGVLGPEGDTPERSKQSIAEFAAGPVANGQSRARVDEMLSLSMRAVRDAPPARGRFPLVLFLHSSPWGESVMSEYLASHGYIVAGIVSKGASETAYRLSRENLDAMVEDALFTISRMRRESNVGDQLGVVGMSNGSIAALALELRGVIPQAIVSLDGGIGERAGGAYLGERSGGVPTKFTVPLLHLYSPDNPHLDFQYLRSYESSPRMLVRVGHLRHGDFIAWGALEREYPGASGPAPADVPIGFELVCRYTLEFFRLHVAGDEGARSFLSGSPISMGAPGNLLVIENWPRAGS